MTFGATEPIYIRPKSQPVDGGGGGGGGGGGSPARDTSTIDK